MLRKRRAQRRVCLEPVRRAQGGGEPIRGRLAEARWVDPVCEQPIERDPRLADQLLVNAERLADRHLLRHGHEHRSAPAVIGKQALDGARLFRDGPGAGDAGIGAGCPQQCYSVAARRRVDDHQVVAARAASLSPGLRQLPDLPDRHQLAQSGCGGGHVLEDRARAQEATEPPSLQSQILLHRILRVDRHGRQAGCELALQEAISAVPEC